jgi:hypothetical protein
MRTWTRWQDWVNAVAGAWLFITPWVYGYAASGYGPYSSTTSRGAGAMAASGSAMPWNAWILGGAILIVALFALGTVGSAALEWLNAIFGAWMFISPWVLGFSGSPAPAWTAWVVGAVVCILSLWTLAEMMRPVTQVGQTQPR